MPSPVFIGPSNSIVVGSHIPVEIRLGEAVRSSSQGLEVQNHSDFITMEIFRAAAAFAPYLGWKFRSVLPSESKPFEEIFGQCERVQTVYAQLFGLIFHGFD
jgi:hypothetical protein